MKAPSILDSHKGTSSVHKDWELGEETNELQGQIRRCSRMWDESKLNMIKQQMGGISQTNDEETIDGAGRPKVELYPGLLNSAFARETLCTCSQHESNAW